MPQYSSSLHCSHSVFVIFPRPPSLRQSETRALSSILQNDHFPVCFRGNDVAVIYEDQSTHKHYINTPKCVLVWCYSLCFIREKRKTEQHTNKTASVKASAAHPPSGVTHCIQAEKELFYQWQLLRVWRHAGDWLPIRCLEVLLWDKSIYYISEELSVSLLQEVYKAFHFHLSTVWKGVSL